MPALSNVSGTAPSPRVAEEILAQTSTGGGTNVADLINQALAPPPATGGRSVGNLFGSDMPAPSSVDGSAPVSAPPAVDTPDLAAQLIAESQARRGTEPGAAVGTFDAPAPQDNALIEQLIAGSEARRGKEPSPAVTGDLTDVEDRRSELLERLGQPDRSLGPVGRFFQDVASAEMPQPRQELVRRRRLEAATASSPLAAQLVAESQARRDREPSAAIGNFEELIDIANNQSTAVQTDAQRGVITDSATDPDVVNTALAGDTSSSLSDRSTTVDEKDTNRTGTGGGKAVQGTGSAEGRLASRVGEGSEFRELAQTASIRRAGELSGRMSLAEMIENQERPTLSYQSLISDFEKQMESQLADIKREKGSQALIALGAGIARGDLGAGLSDAGKAAAASNAQKRALEARQQAMQMGLRKSEIDAAFQSEVQKQANKLEAQKTRISALESYGAKQDAAEQAVLNFENGIDTTLANIGVKRDYYDQLSEQQKETSRRAILNYVEGIISRQNMAGQNKQAQDAMRQQLLREAANILNVPVGEISGSTNKGEGEDQVIEFDDQGKRI